MNQPFDEELISAYLDDELSDEERRDVERLLAERPEAQRLLDELRGLRENLQALPAYRLQEDFGAAVLRRAEREMLRSPNSPTPTTAPPATTAGPPAGSGSSPGITQPASLVERNWRRPAGWSLLAVAAAVVLMYVERQQRDAQPIAMKQPAELEKTVAPAMRAAGKREENTQQEKQLFDKQKDLDESVAMGRGNAMLKVGPPLTKSGAGAAVLVKPSYADAEISDKVQIANQPVIAPGNPMVVMNSIPNPAPAAAAPAAVAQPALPLATTLPTTPLPVPGAGNVAQTPLAEQVLTSNGTLAGGGVGGFGQLSAGGGGSGGGYGGGIDMKPLIATNDYNRARSLVAEYAEARNEVADDRQAAGAFARRIQQAPAERTTQLRDQLDYRPASKNDQLLIVQCDVTPEGLRQGLAPILLSQQIADLTSLQQSAGQGNFNLADGAQAADPSFDKVGKLETDDKAKSLATEEEFIYVVAETKQLEGTLDALRRQSEYFVNLQVEPAPTNVQQQAWRSYNRGQELRGNSSEVAADSPTQAAPSPSLAANPPVTTPTAEPIAKKLADSDAEQKRVAVQKTFEEAAKLRELGQTQRFGGGNAPDGANVVGSNAAGQAAPTPPSQLLGGSASQLQGYYGTNSQAVTPLSRAQRLRRADVNMPVSPRSVAIAAKSGASPTTDERLEGAAPSAGGGRKAIPAPAGAPAPSAPAPAIASTAAPKSQTEASTANATKLGVDASLSAANKENLPVGDVTQQKQLGSNGEPAWHELPPDYHEVLFIFRVVNNKPADEARPSGTSAPAKK